MSILLILYIALSASFERSAGQFAELDAALEDRLVIRERFESRIDSLKSGLQTASLPEQAALADSLFVFYAVPMTQRLIYRRNGAETAIDPALAGPMRKELGI